MSKSPNQKLKLICIEKILMEKTDGQHPLTLVEIQAELGHYNISAERKSLYDDIEALRHFGLDIETTKSKSTGYYIASRKFELPELKLLVDAVQSSKFITHKKSSELIKKIEALASVHEARLLQRQVYVANRIKTMNESIYYNVDKIHAGIGQNQKIAFLYFEYGVDKQRTYKHGGEKYHSSPLSLSWDDENYYMLGFDTQAGIIKHYRVDKMDEIELLDEKRDGLDVFEKLDMAQYSKKVFSMFGGQEESLKLCFSNVLVGVILDRFGKDIMIGKVDDEHFSIHVDVKISPQFFGWLAGFGNQAQILSPAAVRDAYFTHVKGILSKDV